MLIIRRVQKFRSDYADLRTQFEVIKTEVRHERAFLYCTCNPVRVLQKEGASRSELFASSTSAVPISPAPGDSRRRFLSTQQQSNPVSESPFRGPEPLPMSNLREDHALREHDFIRNTDSRLDEFLAHGQAVLNDLKDQRNVLKGTQRRLLDAANTMGLSRNVISWIERRRCAYTSLYSIHQHS